MIYGFTFDGRHCKEFGLVMRSKNRPILPEPKIVKEDVPARNGSLDFSEANPFGRTMYNDRDITVECSFLSASLQQTRQTARNVAAWLACGEKKLVFDDEPSVYYMARVVNRIDFAQQIVKVGTFSINFVCRPFAFGTTPSGVNKNVFTVTATKVSSYTNLASLSNGGPLDFYVENFGNVPSRAVIRCVGTFNSLRVTRYSDGAFLQMPASCSGTLLADCDKMKVTLNGNSITNTVSGKFFEFLPGQTRMSVSFSGAGGSMVYEFPYLYF